MVVATNVENNAAPETTKDNRVVIFDTTLRDGEQSPGATMTQPEKLRIVRELEALGVDIVEAGFPAASPGEVRAVAEIADTVSRCQVAALCRTRDRDIEAAWRGVGGAAKPRLHIFIATSAIHLQHKLKMSQAEVLEQIRSGVSACSALTPNVEFSAEDATRSDIGFLREAFAAAIENGATTLNVPDTVGYTMPAEYERIIGEIVGLADRANAARNDAVDRDDRRKNRVVVSCHCHDDLGLAVANSLAAVRAGARQVEGCINGIGERAGNAALEEVVMALRVRRDLLDVTTGIDSRKILGVSRLVRDITGLMVQPNKAIVGKNAFAHEAGIHQHGILNERTTYEIMAPQDVGFTTSNLVLGKHSGRHALRERLVMLGYELTDEQLAGVFADFKVLCDKKKEIYDGDLHSLMTQSQSQSRTQKLLPFELTELVFSGGSEAIAEASVSLKVYAGCGLEADTGSDAIALGGPDDMMEVSSTSSGDGPVNAAIEAIKSCAGADDVVLDSYLIAAVTPGSDAQGEVHIKIRHKEQLFHGKSAHTDVVVASARAFVDALNKAKVLYADEPAATATGEGQ